MKPWHEPKDGIDHPTQPAPAFVSRSNIPFESTINQRTQHLASPQKPKKEDTEYKA